MSQVLRDPPLVDLSHFSETETLILAFASTLEELQSHLVVHLTH